MDRSLRYLPIKELGNDNRGLIVHVIPERFYRGSSSYFTTTFGVVTIMLANILKSIGMTLRTVVLLAVFLTVFILAGLILPITSNNEINWPWFFCLIPLIFVYIILIIAVCSSSTRTKLAQKRIEKSNQTEPSPGKLSRKQPGTDHV